MSRPERPWVEPRPSAALSQDSAHTTWISPTYRPSDIGSSSGQAEAPPRQAAVTSRRVP